MSASGRHRTATIQPARSWLVSAPVLAWITARVAVIGTLAYSRFLVDHTGARAAEGGDPVGLLGWDAAWYHRILEHGYASLPTEALRFFPLLPLVSAPLRLFTSPGVALIVVANLSALAAGVAVHRLTLAETGDRRVADRTAWVMALFPASFIFVMGYAEGLLIAAAAVCFSGLRERRWPLAIVGGFAAGLSRPLGMLLVVPAAVEVVIAWRSGASRRLQSLAAVAAPLAGAATYLAWVGLRFGDALEPLTQQQQTARRGPPVDPFTRLVEAGSQLMRGEEIGSGLHLPWALFFIAMLVVVGRVLPLSYTAFTAVVLLVALSSTNLDSLERYGLSAFPICIAIAHVTRAPWAERAALGLSTAGMVLYASLAFLGVYVP